MASPPSLDGFLRARMRRRCLSLGIDLRIARRAYKALRETGRPNTFAVCGYSPGAGCATPRVFAFGASLDEAFSKARRGQLVRRGMLRRGPGLRPQGILAAMGGGRNG